MLQPSMLLPFRNIVGSSEGLSKNGGSAEIASLLAEVEMTFCLEAYFQPVEGNLLVS